MKKIQKRYIAIALSVLLVLIGITTTLAVMPKPTEPTVIVEVEPEVILDAREIIKLTNDYRATKGLEPYAESLTLNQSACAKAQHMVDNKYWQHVAPDGTEPWYFFQQVGYNYSRAGENLAYGHKTDRQVVDSWIKSPKHEANLVGQYEELGVCTLNNVMFQGGTNTVIVAHYGTLVQ